MSERFTKGPWVATETASGRGKVSDCMGFSICNLTAGSYRQQQNDAALIACAPEMYEMLNKVSQLIDNDGGAAIDWLIENTFDIRELLAKARGEQ